MPYSQAAYAMAIVAEIDRLHEFVREHHAGLEWCRSMLDNPEMVRQHAVIREFVQDHRATIASLEQNIQRRSMHMYSTVSPFPWPIQVEPGSITTCDGCFDPVLEEWDMYVRGN